MTEVCSHIFCFFDNLFVHQYARSNRIFNGEWWTKGRESKIMTKVIDVETNPCFSRSEKESDIHLQSANWIKIYNDHTHCVTEFSIELDKFWCFSNSILKIHAGRVRMCELWRWTESHISIVLLLILKFDKIVVWKIEKKFILPKHSRIDGINELIETIRPHHIKCKEKNWFRCEVLRVLLKTIAHKIYHR